MHQRPALLVIFLEIMQPKENSPNFPRPENSINEEQRWQGLIQKITFDSQSKTMTKKIKPKYGLIEDLPLQK